MNVAPTDAGLIVPFVAENSGAEEPTLGEVGGKGLSLIRLSRAGFPVPLGCVLTVRFFDPWMDEIRAHPAWEGYVAAAVAADGDGGSAALAEGAAELMAAAQRLTLPDDRRSVLAAALAPLGPGARVAVRSSSPEEDLEGSSFAGGYASVLGASSDDLEAALRVAFASALDARVVTYKRQHDFDPRSPRVAVVVQQMVDAEAAGVAFSIDPITNDYDVASISANWGLGESVVSGTASPDLFLVDKAARRVLERTRGAKETSVWLGRDGATETRSHSESSEDFALNDGQLRQLTDMVGWIEDLYERPVDVEWAAAGGSMHLLQARPVTGHVDLPDDLRTVRGAARRLYWDATIGVQGILRPMSPLGTSIFAAFLSQLSQTLVGIDVTENPETAVPVARHGRLYLNVSNLLGIAGEDRLLRYLRRIDPTTARALEAASRSLPHAPGLARYRADGSALRALRRPFLRGMAPRVGRVAGALVAPRLARRRVERARREYTESLRALAGHRSSMSEWVPLATGRTARLAFDRLLPRFVASRVALALMHRLVPETTPDREALLARLDQALPGNVTVEMGLALGELARLVPADWDPDGSALAVRLDAGDGPAPLQRAWRQFLDQYGHRGPGEIDPVVPRFREEPRLVLDQVAALRSGPAGLDAHHEAIRAREAAARQLEAAARSRGRWAGRAFRHLSGVVTGLGGLREAPKYHLVQVVDLVRSQARRDGAELADAGRLDHPDDVFSLPWADLAAVVADPALDARGLAAAARRGGDRLARARELPRLIDSRGRILRAPPLPVDGSRDLAGQPISPGTVRGRVRIMHRPDEGTLQPGEILVARATDPGWTPLFVPAAAVVLEVGGPLQHGALVAREYGKPCVAGVEAATERLVDGTEVEVDGAAGLVRVLPGKEPA